MSKLKKNIRLDVTTMLNKIVSGSTSEDRHGNNQYIPYNGTDSKSITVHDGHRCRDGNFRYVFEKRRFPQVRPSASLECLGGLLGWLWRSGVLLGGVLGGQNVAISLVLDGFLRGHAF